MSSLKDIMKGAQEDGLLDQSAVTALTTVDLGNTIQDNLGIDASLIDSNEIFGLMAIIDDSGSIRFSGNTQVVRDGYNLILDGLLKSNARDDIIVAATLLNGGIIQAPASLKDAVRLDNHNYNPMGGTPLYDRSIELGALAVAKHQEARSIGAAFRGVILIVSDGKDEGSRSDVRKVNSVLTALQKDEVFQVIAMGIDDGRTDFKAVFKEMGVLEENILTVTSDPHSIRQAFGVVSRATVSASQGGSVSQSGGLGGFAP